MSSGDTLTDMRLTIEELISDLRENIFKQYEGEILLVEFFFKKNDNNTIMNHMIDNILPYEEQIEKREESFFLQNKSTIFAGLPVDRVSYFSELLQKDEKNGGISNEDRSVIWSYFDTIVGIAKKHKKVK